MAKLASIFRDHAVIQAGDRIRLFGTLEEGERLPDVTLDGEKAEIKEYPYKKAMWYGDYTGRKAGGPFKLFVKVNGENTELDDVYFGDVFLFAGQSNVQLKMADVNTPESEYENDIMLRTFNVNRPKDGGYWQTEDDGWRVCKKEDVAEWSALCYLAGEFYRKDHPETPVGVVNCSSGASVIQSWMAPDILSEPKYYVPKEELFIDHTFPDFAERNAPSALYGKMLLKVAPFGYRSVMWYQGESNTSEAEGKIYTDLLDGFIKGARRAMMNGCVPFTVVQIADTRTVPGWLLVQKAQEKAPEVIENTVLVRSGDISEKEMIHPVTKGPLAKRIAAHM